MKTIAESFTPCIYTIRGHFIELNYFYIILDDSDTPFCLSIRVSERLMIRKKFHISFLLLEEKYILGTYITSSDYSTQLWSFIIFNMVSITCHLAF